jgi:hypothetical protein
VTLPCILVTRQQHILSFLCSSCLLVSLMFDISFIRSVYSRRDRLRRVVRQRQREHIFQGPCFPVHWWSGVLGLQVSFLERARAFVLRKQTHYLVSHVKGRIWDWGWASESESESVRLGAKPPERLTTSNFIFQLDTCGYSPYVTPSLTRQWVCRLQLLLVFASAVILRSESHGTHDHIILSQIRDSLEGPGPRIYIPQEQGGPVIPQVLGFLLVASYDSQRYGGGIRPCLRRTWGRKR